MQYFDFRSMYRFVFLALTLWGVYVKSKLVRTVQIKEFVGCHNMKLPFHVDRITVNVTGKGQITLNGYLDIDEDLGNLTLISITVEKCNSMSDRSSCEFFATLNNEVPCQSIVTRGMFWTDALDRIKPRVKCPVKKDIYVVHESSLDASLTSKLIQPGNFWRSTAKVFVGKRLVLCFHAGLELVEVRERSKSRKAAS